MHLALQLPQQLLCRLESVGLRGIVPQATSEEWALPKYHHHRHERCHKRPVPDHQRANTGRRF